MDKTEAKQLIKDRIARDPPLEWYLKENQIYGRFIANVMKEVTKQRTVFQCCSLICIISDIFDYSYDNPINRILNDHKYPRRRLLDFIYKH